MWGLVPPLLGATPLAGNSPSQLYCTKRVVPHCLGLRPLGNILAGHYIICQSDNTAAVAQVNKLHAKDPLAAHLLHCLAFFQASFDFHIRAVHISGQLNTGADDLS